MQPQNTRPVSRLTALALALLVAGLSCLCLPENFMPAIPTEGPPAAETSPPTGTMPPTELPAPADTPLSPPESSTLNAEGPWLLIDTSEGLWAANPDGSGMTQFTEVDYWGENLEWAVQPGGNQVVFISSTDSYRNMSLNLLSLPGGEVTKITNLTSPETETYADLGQGEPGFEAMRAITWSGPAWSPDGTRLAFIGLMDGPTAEVYLYTVASGEVTRVSRDEAQNYWVSWSPDGAHLLYFGTDGFGTGGGFFTTGAWSARGDGTNVTWLYVPQGGDEEQVGWLDGTTAVLSTCNAVCGCAALRLYDIITTEKTMLNEDCFISAAAIGWRGLALFANEDGLYLVTADERKPVQVGQEKVSRIDPPGPDDYVFTLRLEDGGLATAGEGEIERQASPVYVPPRYKNVDAMDVAEYGLIWAWTSMDEDQPGAWITGPGVEIGQIYPGKAVAPIWDADNNLLFFALQEGGGYRIYRTTFETFYRDLNEVGFLDANLRSVAWLEGR